RGCPRFWRKGVERVRRTKETGPRGQSGFGNVTRRRARRCLHLPPCLDPAEPPEDVGPLSLRSAWDRISPLRGRSRQADLQGAIAGRAFARNKRVLARNDAAILIEHLELRRESGAVPDGPRELSSTTVDPSHPGQSRIV